MKNTVVIPQANASQYQVIRAPQMKAKRTPMLPMNWTKQPRIPLMSVEAISTMYTVATASSKPSPIPPRNLKNKYISLSKKMFKLTTKKLPSKIYEGYIVGQKYGQITQKETRGCDEEQGLFSPNFLHDWSRDNATEEAAQAQDASWK